MTKKWTLLNQQDDALVSELAKSLNISIVLARLLVQRGYDTFDKARTFFRPSLDNLYDPFLMKDMDKAVSRVEKAIIDQEKILIFGDYDVDGTSAVALVYSFIKQYNTNIEYYIPNRDTEGYGISQASIDYVAENGITLMIVLDCGIKAFEQIGRAAEKNIDVIVCDHHRPGDSLPNAYAILNPKRQDCDYPFKELSGCGVGFKLIQGYVQKNNLPFSDLEQYLDLVTISIASDLVPIIDENRILAHYGLRVINTQPRIGLKTILNQSNVKLRPDQVKGPLESIFSREISISDIVFLIGPRINAAGRIDTGRNSVNLLICNTDEKAESIAAMINDYNTLRQEKDKATTSEALNIIENDPFFSQQKATIVYHPDWHKGVIGIVASRLVEKYYKPTIVFTQSNGLITGSARSVKDFDIYDAIDNCSDLLEHFGGHKYAAGLSMLPENYLTFKERFEKIVFETITEEAQTPEITIDSELQLSEVDAKFLNVLKQFAPFGPDNMAPVFRTNHVIQGDGKIVGEKHLKLNISHPKFRDIHSAIGFNLAEEFASTILNASPPQRFDIAYSIEENEYYGRINMQLNIKDITIPL
ncbi:MAG: single-stranded-DNA-specific exonuclease RecJ [Bacteroidota bacterium]